jgi:hypothetical protein
LGLGRSRGYGFGLNLGWGGVEGTDWAVSTGFELDGQQVAVIALRRSVLQVVLAAKYFGTVAEADARGAFWNRRLGLQEVEVPPALAVEFANPFDALSSLVDRLYPEDGRTPTPGDVVTYMWDVPVPVFGSPPRSLSTLNGALTGMVPAAAIVLPSVPNMPSTSHMIVAGAASTLWITFGRPSLKVTGAAYQRWLQRRLRVTAADLRRYSGPSGEA